MSIAAYLRKSGIHFKVMDANIHFADIKYIQRGTLSSLSRGRPSPTLWSALSKADFPFHALSDYLRQNAFDAVLLDCHFTGTVNTSIMTMRLVRSVLPNCTIITGGIHATYFSREIMASTPANVIVKGEGEEVCAELIRTLDRGLAKLADVEGIVFRHGNDIVETPGRGLVKDLDTLAPVSDVYEDFEITKYRDYVKAIKGPFWSDQDPAGVLITSRGCIGRCSFCNARIVDSGCYRSHSAERIAAMTSHIVSTYAPQKIGLYDAMLGGNKEHLGKVVECMRQYNVKWGCETRIDVMTEDKLDLLKDSNCAYVLYGLESVNPITLQLNGKVPGTHERAERFIAHAKRLIQKTSSLGIEACVSILYGLPGDDHLVGRRTLEFIRKAEFHPSRSIFFIFYPPIAYPGTELWESTPEKMRCYEWDKYFVHEENNIDEDDIIYKNPSLDVKSIRGLIQYSYDEYYGKPAGDAKRPLGSKIANTAALIRKSRGQCTSVFAAVYLAKCIYGEMVR